MIVLSEPYQRLYVKLGIKHTWNTIDGLRNDVANARFDASQNAQTGTILADNAAQTRILNPTPVPAYIVPNYNGCNCNQGYYNYGCGA